MSCRGPSTTRCWSGFSSKPLSGQRLEYQLQARSLVMFTAAALVPMLPGARDSLLSAVHSKFETRAAL